MLEQERLESSPRKQHLRNLYELQQFSLCSSFKRLLCCLLFSGWPRYLNAESSWCGSCAHSDFVSSSCSPLHCTVHPGLPPCPSCYPLPRFIFPGAPLNFRSHSSITSYRKPSFLLQHWISHTSLCSLGHSTLTLKWVSCLLCAPFSRPGPS